MDKSCSNSGTFTVHKGTKYYIGTPPNKHLKINLEK